MTTTLIKTIFKLFHTKFMYFSFNCLYFIATIARRHDALKCLAKEKTRHYIIQYIRKLFFANKTFLEFFKKIITIDNHVN